LKRRLQVGAFALGICAEFVEIVFPLTLGSPVGTPVSDAILVRVTIHIRNGEHENNNVPLSVSMIEFVQKRADAFSGVFGWSVYDLVLKDNGVSHGRRGAMVSGNTFDVLGLHAVAGRWMGRGD
jgi:hypothetical protein